MADAHRQGNDRHLDIPTVVIDHLHASVLALPTTLGRMRKDTHLRGSNRPILEIPMMVGNPHYGDGHSQPTMTGLILEDIGH